MIQTLKNIENPPQIPSMTYGAKENTVLDYYPFGTLMPGRNVSNDSYSYGFNGKEKDDELKGNGNSYDFGARIYDPRIGRWLSTDPQEQNYPSETPYNFVLNSPICFIDPNGEEVTIHGADANETVTALQKVTSLEISIDANGKLSAQIPNEPITLSKLDLALLDAIVNEDVSVNLYTTKMEFFDSKDGTKDNPILIGSYDGSEIIDGKVETTQLFNIDQSKKVEKAGLSTVGTDAVHEIIESFKGGQDDPGGDYTSGFKSAHAKATAADPNAPEIGNYNDGGNGDYGVTDKNGNNPVPLTNKKNVTKKFVKPLKK